MFNLNRISLKSVRRLVIYNISAYFFQKEELFFFDRFFYFNIMATYIFSFSI